LMFGYWNLVIDWMLEVDYWNLGVLFVLSRD
jgi:hypothetical protein